jgi:Transglycosylase SLT domain
MPRWIGVSLATLMALGVTVPAGASEDQRWTLPTTIAAASAWADIAPELLGAVTWVESRGRPWALNIGGVGFYPRTHAEALALLRAVSGRADIGLAQIHYALWGPVFGFRPEDLLDPWANLHVAAQILRYAMDREPGSWGGVGRYHSATLWRKWQYAREVAAVVRALRPPPLPPAP